MRGNPARTSNLLAHDERRAFASASQCGTKRLDLGLRPVVNVFYMSLFVFSQFLARLFDLQLNFEGTGFYRVNYPNEFLSRFISAIQNKSLPPPDRLIVINDLFAMVS